METELMTVTAPRMGIEAPVPRTIQVEEVASLGGMLTGSLVGTAIWIAAGVLLYLWLG